jgi:hypothetical protein
VAAPVVEAQERHPSRKALVDELGRDHDEGGPIDEARYAKVRARFEALGEAGKLWMSTIVVEAQRAGVPFYMTQARTFRRYWLYGALIMLAERDLTEPAYVRELAALATGSDAPRFPTITLGHAVGAMNVDEARRFCDAAAN